jgi:TatD DNase family protein
MSAMIDSHCHLTDPRLLNHLSGVLARAQAAGIDRMVTIGTSLEDAKQTVDLCHKLPNVRCAIGVHPNYSHEAQLEDLDGLRMLQADSAVVALGEMGLDYHHNFAPRARQQMFFEPQLQMAVETGKPVVIHCREACDDCLAIMKNFPAVRAVFHCFTADAAEAKKVLDAGHLLGFTGAITFKKADALREAVALTPADRFLIETDAPYLTPEPMRKQKTNEPALVVHVAEMIARVKGWSVAEASRLATENTERFYGMDRPTDGLALS